METVDGTSRSTAKVATRARGQAEKANDGLFAKLRVAFRRKLRTYPVTPRIADVAAIDTHANPNNPSHGQHISPLPSIRSKHS